MIKFVCENCGHIHNDKHTEVNSSVPKEKDEGDNLNIDAVTEKQKVDDEELKQKAIEENLKASVEMLNAFRERLKATAEAVTAAAEAVKDQDLPNQ